MDEIWEDIPSYEGLYQVSNFGRVKSFDTFMDTRWGTKKPFPGRVLKPETTAVGYHRVVLTKNKVTRRFSVHYLVMLTFKGERPEGYFINHIDSKRMNNKPENLEYVTPKENTLHSMYATGKSRRGQNNNASKLTDKQVIEIRKLFKTGDYTKTKLGQMFGVTDVLIGVIVRRQSWKHIA